ncbi:MAG TPA: glycosyltransferase [Thermodesulfovibrionales bacterium]|nr:glycosyltransferase [Thermodesulfovibrionales bacterium]
MSSLTLSGAACGGKPRTLFFISSLEGGGAERAMVDILNRITPGMTSSALLLLHPYYNSSYKAFLPAGLNVMVVQRKDEGFLSKVGQFLSFLKAVKDFRPEVLVSMLTHNNIMAAAAGLLFGMRVIVVEQNTLSEVIKTPRGGRVLGLPAGPLVRFFYGFADSVIAVSEGVKQDLVESFGLEEDKIRIIYNPIDLNRISGLIKGAVRPQLFEGHGPVIIAVGRLVRQKGFSVLLKAFKRVSEQINARLVIIGEGPEREALEGEARQLNLTGKVRLIGFMDNPYAYLSKADLFVLSSYYEGFPIALIEALACGVPVISTDCKSGPREILANCECGLLSPVGEPEALSEGMLRLLKDGKLREALSSAGRVRAKDFSILRVAGKYEEVISGRPVLKHFGNLVIAVEGTGEIYRNVLREMDAFPEADPGAEADIVYRFLPRPFLFYGKAWENHGYKTPFYNVGSDAGCPRRLVLSPAAPLKDRLLRLLPVSLQRAVYAPSVGRPFNSLDLVTEAFFYDIFYLSTQIALLMRGGSYIRAAAVADGDKAYVFAGSRKSGKTSIMRALLKRPGTGFLSDDIVAVDREGTAYFNGRAVLIRADDLENPGISGLGTFSSRLVGIICRTLRRKDGWFIKVPYQELSGTGRTVRKADIKYCFYLSRAEDRSKKKITLNRLDATRFSELVLRDLSAVLQALAGYAAVLGPTLPPGWITEQTAAIYREAFSRTECFELLIPAGLDLAAAGLSLESLTAGAEG